MNDFWGLTIWPETSAYLMKTFLRTLMLELVPLQNNIMSSAYNICEGIWRSLVPLISLSLFSLTNLDKLLLITSSARQNKRGDNGSPCLTPLVQLKSHLISYFFWKKQIYLISYLLKLTRKQKFALILT